jgi:hypothetical protein
MKNKGKIISGLLGIFFGLLLCAGIQTASAGPVIEFGEESWLMLNYEAQLYFQWTDQGSGDDGMDDTTDVFFRRNRLIFRGQLNDTFGFNTSIEFQGDRRIFSVDVTEDPGRNFDILDAFFIADFSDAARFRLGLTKDPMVRAQNEGCFFALGADRSQFSYQPLRRLNRDFGAVAWGNLFDAKVQYRLAAMQGNEDSDDPESSLRYTGRLHLTLLDPEHSIVYRASYLGKKKVLTFGAGYQVEPDAVFGNLSARTLEKTYQAWTFDGFFDYPTSAGTFTLSTAYLETDFDEAYKGADPDPRSIGINGEKNGWYAQAGYLLPMKVGPGDLQFFGRYENWKFAQLSGVFDQEIDWYGAGVNYYLFNEALRLTLEYYHNDFDVEDAINQDSDTVTAMVQLLF